MLTTLNWPQKRDHYFTFGTLGYPPELGAQDKNDVIADADSGEKASDDDSANGNAGYDTTLQPPAITRSFSDLAENKLRNLDEWCYVERFERNVFIQVIEIVYKDVKVRTDREKNKERAIFSVWKSY